MSTIHVLGVGDVEEEEIVGNVSRIKFFIWDGDLLAEIYIDGREDPDCLIVNNKNDPQTMAVRWLIKSHGIDTSHTDDWGSEANTIFKWCYLETPLLYRRITLVKKTEGFDDIGVDQQISFGDHEFTNSDLAGSYRLGLFLASATQSSTQGV